MVNVKGLRKINCLSRFIMPTDSEFEENIELCLKILEILAQC